VSVADRFRAVRVRRYCLPIGRIIPSIACPGTCHGHARDELVRNRCGCGGPRNHAVSGRVDAFRRAPPSHPRSAIGRGSGGIAPPHREAAASPTGAVGGCPRCRRFGHLTHRPAVRSSSPRFSRNRPRWRGQRDPAARISSRRARPARQFGRCGPLGGVCSCGAATNRVCGHDGIPCDHIVVIIGPFGSLLLVKVKACLILDSAVHRPRRNGPWRPPPLMVSVTAS